MTATFDDAVVTFDSSTITFSGGAGLCLYDQDARYDVSTYDGCYAPPLPHVRALWRPEQFTRVSNPGFENNLGGWSVAAGINAAGTSITRITTDFQAGAACASVVTGTNDGGGVNFDLGADTYYPEATYGTVYAALVYLKWSAGARKIKLIMGSEGTGADRASTTITLQDAWTPYRVLWMPTAARTDAQVAITNIYDTTTVLIDGLTVYAVDAFSQVENSNFFASTTGWAIAGANIAAAATSLTRITTDGMDPDDLSAATLVTTGTSGSGADYPLGNRKFTSGRTYRAMVAAKSVSGTPSGRLRLGSIGPGADRGDQAITLTTSWALYTVDWTASADRTDGCIAVSNGAASVMTANMCFVEVYEALDDLNATTRPDVTAMNWRRGDNFDSSGAAPGTIRVTLRDHDLRYTPEYTSGPLYGSLDVGKRLWGRATWASRIYPLFYGSVRQIVPRPFAAQCDLMAEDPMLDLAKATASVQFSYSFAYWKSRGYLFGPDALSSIGERHDASSVVGIESNSFFGGTNGPTSMLA